MSVEGMVGSIGLTLFCNKCVELFYKFKKDGIFTEELQRTCERAIYAFKSFEWPNRGDLISYEKAPFLFNTNEEVKSLEQMMSAQNEKFDNTTLDKWISKLERILADDIGVEEKKDIAKELQKFFDTLGDYSFYVSRDALRS